MDIFDRWGGHVFLSRDIELGWNGQKNGQIVAAGLYIYRIQWRQTSGELQEVSGGVVLMY
jgi:gliding motility-associated-like protein